ncbi:MAG: Fe-S oxidoreductase [Dehalococcoidia bacterium]|nr:Fe-S oxidoreductase [Dehalococcoidia bacterium]
MNISTPNLSASPSYFDVDFNQTPFTLAWEITRACALNCIHCRAEAQKKHHPQELTKAEGLSFIDQIVEMGKPILIVTGGDPMMRRDVFDFLNYAVSKGLRVALSPSATKLVRYENLCKVKEAGVHMVHISMDGSSPEIHDTFRGFRGSFQRTTEILEDLGRLSMPIQIGTTVNRHNLQDLPAIARVVEEMGVTVWSVFFLVPTGRGKATDMITPLEHEEVYNWLYALSKNAPFHIRTTAAPSYRRVVIQHTRQEQGLPTDIGSDNVKWEMTGSGYAFREGRAPQERGVGDGNGFCFVSHIGDVCPSGFLQIPAGNVRNQPITEIYRNSPLFQDLRDQSKLKGKCGVCEFKGVCGGSRARAFAVTGDYLAADPSCSYVPQALRSSES